MLRRQQYAVFKYYIFILFFAHCTYFVFSGTEKTEEFCIVCDKPGVLCMGRAKVCLFDDDIGGDWIYGGTFNGKITEKTGDVGFGIVMPWFSYIF